MMTNPKVNPLLRVLPSLTDVAFILPVILLFGRLDGVKTLLGDGDTGWHIRTGEWILAHHAIPHKDLFSFTKPNAPWFAWEWLWDVAFAWLHLYGGLAAVVIASILVICLTSALLFRLTLRNCQNRLIAIAIVFLAMSGSSIHWLARPHLFTMLFVVIWLAILDRVEQGAYGLLWLLPLLTTPWTNLHGGFFVGILLTGTYGAGKALEALFQPDAAGRTQLFRRAGKYLIAAVASLAASLINPYTFHLHQHILEYLGDATQMDGIQEFSSISFHSPGAIYFEIMLPLAILAAIGYVRKRQFAPALLVVGWAHLGLLAARNIPLFLLIASPFVAATLDRLLTTVRERSAELPAWINEALSPLHEIGQEVTTFDRPWRVHALTAAVAVLLCVTISGRASQYKLKAEYDSKHFPAGALALLQKDCGDRRVFSSFEWGDYLVYRLYPAGGRVFMDGRGDFYGGPFFRNYLDIMGANYDWEAKLDRYQVDTILVSTKSAIAQAVKESPHWNVVYDDGTAVLFEAATAPNRISTARGNEHAAERLPMGIAGLVSSKHEGKQL